MNDRFRDKVALVSGAAQGIGLGVARRLLEEGARVVAVDRSGWSTNWPATPACA